MKTKEELNALKREVESLKRKLAELTEDELMQVAGGDAKDPAPGPARGKRVLIADGYNTVCLPFDVSAGVE